MSPHSLIFPMIEYLQVASEGVYSRKGDTRVYTLKGLNMERLNILYVFVQSVFKENFTLTVNEAKDTAVLTFYESKPEWMLQAEAHGWTPPKIPSEVS